MRITDTINMTAACSSGLVDDALLARQLTALAHPARLSIVRHLACADHCSCKDVVAGLPLAQSTVSQHLKVLAEAGLVRREPRPPHSRYSLDRAALNALGQTLERFAAACCDPEMAGLNADESSKDTSLV